MKVVAVNCPNCGAGLRAGEGAAEVTCAYCGTVSRVQRRTVYFERPVKLPPGPKHLPVAVQRHTKRWGASVFAALLTLVVAGAGVSMAIYQARRAARGASVFAGGVGGSTLSWQGTGGAVFADVDGDGAPEIIGRTRYVGKRDAVTLSAFSAQTGERRWESEALGTYIETYQGPLALARTRLVYASLAGSLVVLRVVDGVKEFELPLGERVARLCQRADDDLLYVERKDKTWASVDLALRQLATVAAPKACVDLPSDAGASPLAFSQRDFDRRAKPPKVAGMSVAAVIGANDELAVGNKHPGTAVPMLAYLEGKKKTRWAIEVPDGLSVAEGAPLLATLDGDSAYAVYARKGGKETVVTAFELATGQPRFTSRVPEGFGSSVFEACAVIGDRLLISAWGRLEAFDTRSGAHEFRIGR